MPIDELIAEIEKIRDEYGDIDVYAWNNSLNKRAMIENVTVAHEGEGLVVVDLEF